MPSRLEAYFQSRLDKYQSESDRLSQQMKQVSLIRLLVFVLTFAGVYWATYQNALAVTAVLVLGFGSFVFLVRRHQRLEEQLAHSRALVKVNQNELKRLAHDTKGLDEGADFRKDGHSYASDLDIFGSKSVFQLVNRTVLNGSRKKVAEHLLTPTTDRILLKKRQQAVAELSTSSEWRQQFEATGRALSETHEHPISNNDVKDILQWVQSEDTHYDRWYFWLALILVPATGIAVIYGIISHQIPPVSFLFFLLLPVIILLPRLGKLNRIYLAMSKKTRLLRKYARLFALIEMSSFNSELLREVRKTCHEGEKGAGTQIHQLSRIMEAFDYRLNMIMGVVLNVFLLWDLMQAIRLEQWKKANSENVAQWFEALHNIDELISFAGFSFMVPAGIIPEISDEDMRLEGEQVRHPLISWETCVGNPVSYQGWHQFKIITGANMAGKSTYLRTIGVNLVLALAGTKVLADKFVFSPVQVFTGIKTTDSLQDGESYFYAELKRLKEMIERLKSGEGLFIILDEILRGTNSVDKQRGSKELLKRLFGYNASGIIATHDLSLGDLADDYREEVMNHCFEVEIESDSLRFDYLLKDGVAQNLNASFLMKKMDIIP